MWTALRTCPRWRVVRSALLPRGTRRTWELPGDGVRVRIGCRARRHVPCGWLVATQGQFPHAGNRLQDVAGARQQAQTGGQKLHAACSATKQRSAKFVFKTADLATKRRLRDVQTAGRPPDVALFGHCHKVTQLIQAHGARIARGPARSVASASYLNGIGAAGAPCGIVEP